MRPVIAARLLAFLGAAAYHLGVLAAVSGRTDDAVAHLEAALDRHLEMGAKPFAALTQQALADVLLCRAAPGDEERARELRAAALATAEELGLAAARVSMQA